MLRDLATMLQDLQRGMQQATSGSGVRIAHAEMVLPVDMALVLKNGGCRLLADVTRNPADAAWHEAPSRLSVVWQETPTESLP